MPKELDDLDRKLKLAVTQLDRQFGKGTIMDLSADPEPWPSISTGALSLDLALGIGGIPRGRITELYGTESSGKTTLALTMIANAQKEGLKCLFLDAEHALDPAYAQALGVNLQDLLFAQPSTGEEAMHILDTMISTGAIGLAVIDSVAALTPKAELEGDIGDNHVGRLARLMAQTMRKITSGANKTHTAVLFVNQIREKIGVMFGSPEITPGGRALKFSCSVRMDIRKIGNITAKQDGDNIGSEVRVKIPKNKMAPPLKKAEFKIFYGRGVNYLDSVIEAGVDSGILVRKSGGWISYDGESIGQGNDNAIQVLASDMEFTNMITKQIWNKARGITDEPETDDASDDSEADQPDEVGD